MAYSVPVGDTKITEAGGALDKKAVSSARTAKGLVPDSPIVKRPRFSRSPVPRANTRSTVPVASSSSPQSSGARKRKDSLGNDIGDAITKIAGSIDASRLFQTGNASAAISLVDATESPLSNPFAPQFSPTNVNVAGFGVGGGGGGGFGSAGSSPAFSSPGFFKDGGFIRRKS